MLIYCTVLKTVNDSFDWCFGMVLCFSCQGFCVHIMTLLKGSNVVFSVRKLTNYPWQTLQNFSCSISQSCLNTIVFFFKCIIYAMSLGLREL